VQQKKGALAVKASRTWKSPEAAAAAAASAHPAGDAAPSAAPAAAPAASSDVAQPALASAAATVAVAVAKKEGVSKPSVKREAGTSAKKEFNALTAPSAASQRPCRFDLKCNRIGCPFSHPQRDARDAKFLAGGADGDVKALSATLVPRLACYRRPGVSPTACAAVHAPALADTMIGPQRIFMSRVARPGAT
jgi:hypothetical protein